MAMFLGIDYTWNDKTINDEVRTYLHNKQKQCGVGYKICPGAITKLLFFEYSRELLHQELNTSSTICLCLKFQYWYFLYQGLVQKVPLLVEKIPDLGTKLFSLEILTIRI